MRMLYCIDHGLPGPSLRFGWGEEGREVGGDPRRDGLDS